MRRAAFLLLFAAGLVLWYFSPAGLYLSAALLAAAVIAAVENLLDKPEEKVTYDELFPRKGHSPVVTFSGTKRLKGRIPVENLLTGSRTAAEADITRERTFTLPAQNDCGTLLIRFVQFYRYDMLGLTRRLVVCSRDTAVTVMPDEADISMLTEPDSGGSELDGARELRDGEPLRRMNYKLTHRFGKPYINIYAPESTGELWLFGDLGQGDRAAAAAEKLCTLAQKLTDSGTPFGLALTFGEGRIEMYERPDTETVLSEVLRCPLYRQAESALPELLRRLPDDAEIIAFTPNDTVRDERLTVVY